MKKTKSDYCICDEAFGINILSCPIHGKAAAQTLAAQREVAGETQNNLSPRSLHTPGPWHRGRLSVQILSNRGEVIALLYGVDNLDDPSPIQRANGDLIASAPELLEACKRLLEHAGIADAHPEDIDGEDHQAESAARAAIAKAEGKA